MDKNSQIQPNLAACKNKFTNDQHPPQRAEAGLIQPCVTPGIKKQSRKEGLCYLCKYLIKVEITSRHEIGVQALAFSAALLM